MDVMGREDSRIGLLPASAYVQAFAEGRCLELGRGNEEIAFGRAACLDVNAEIVEMAKSPRFDLNAENRRNAEVLDIASRHSAQITDEFP